jgi:antitoxin component YwqK of YwqJK toxin-antitoxin module
MNPTCIERIFSTKRQNKHRKSMKFFRIRLAIVLVCFLSVIGTIAQEPDQKSDSTFWHDETYTGTFQTFFSNGTLASERSFIRGLEDGLSNYYDSTGVLIEQRAWSNGKKHGTWLIFSSKEIKIGEANYYDNQKHGKWFEWDENGILRSEKTFENDMKVGFWYVWDENGKLVSEEDYK